MPKFELKTVAILLSASWLIVFLTIGWLAHPPEDCDPKGGTFGCLTANEWGDYFAGAFAPIAFLWLVVAVFIQAKELRAQHSQLTVSAQELRETREEMKLQRSVMREQASLIGKQTTIIEDQESARKAEAISKRFNSLIREIAVLVEQMSDRLIVRWMRVGGNAQRRSFVASKSGEAVILQFANFLDGLKDPLFDFDLGITESEDGHFRHVKRDLSIIRALSEEALALADDADITDRSVSSRLRLEDIDELIRPVLEKQIRAPEENELPV